MEKIEDTQPNVEQNPAPKTDIVHYLPPSENFDNKICLVMIVRDEAFVLPPGPETTAEGEPTGQNMPVVCRAFSSVINLIDSFVICDTGSNDNTIAVMKDYMEKHGKSGYILSKEWEWFGPTKSYLLKRVYNDGLSQAAKYICWLDADEMFLMEDTKKPPTAQDKTRLLASLDQDPNMGIFYLMTHFGGMRYWRWNFARNDQLYSWGPLPVQEAFEASKPTGSLYINFMYLLARKQGNSSRNTTRARGELLAMTKFLKETDQSSHWWSRGLFYFAEIQGYNGLPEDSVKSYRLRADMKRDNIGEEYISLLRMGRTLLSLGRKSDAIMAWVEATQRFPHRLEAFYELMMGYNQHPTWTQALEWATKAPKKEDQNPNDLFIEIDIVDWKFYMQATCAAFYSEEYDMAHYWASKVLLENKYPKDWKNLLENNLRFATQKIEQRMKTYKEKVTVLPDEFNNLKLSSALTAHRSVKVPHVVVVNNFYENPDGVRKFALAQPFEVKGNYPGFRTKSYATDTHRKMFENILGRKITYWPDQYNGSFQYTIGVMKSWVHRDATDYAAVIYLTPDAPLTTGTTFFRHKKLGREYEDETVKKEMDESSNDMSAWHVADVVANKYNRLILFNGKQSHMSSDYFGDSKENGRLFQTFFFNVELDPSEAWTMTQERPPKK